MFVFNMAHGVRFCMYIVIIRTLILFVWMNYHVLIDLINVDLALVMPRLIDMA